MFPTHLSEHYMARLAPGSDAHARHEGNRDFRPSAAAREKRVDIQEEPGER